MSTTEGIGGILSASAALPATFDEVGYAALTWTEVAEVTELPEYGASHETVTHTPLKTGIKNKFHGELDYGSLAVPMAHDAADPGQIILKAARVSKDEISFKMTYSDGAIDYISGKVMSFTKGMSVGSVVPATSQLEYTRELIEVAAP
jgi:hypothetical protein